MLGSIIEAEAAKEPGFTDSRGEVAENSATHITKPSANKALDKKPVVTTNLGNQLNNNNPKNKEEKAENKREDEVSAKTAEKKKRSLFDKARSVFKKEQKPKTPKGESNENYAVGEIKTPVKPQFVA